jgi:hypothetical protein
MEPDREDQSAGTDLASVREAWRRRSLAGGWLVDDDWHSEAVDAMVSAAYRAAAGVSDTEAGPLAAACAGLGRSRGKAGIGLTETIDDLAALFAVLHGEPPRPARRAVSSEPGDPPLHLVCRLAEGWAEEGLAQLVQDGCEDPLSGLATVPYLRTRLAEVYREAAESGTSPARTHRLLVVGFPHRPDPWRRMALAILVGHDLRATFPGGETLSLARHNGPGPAIALVRAHADLPLRYARLRRSVQATLGAQIRMNRLPPTLSEALRLVDDCLLMEQAR